MKNLFKNLMLVAVAAMAFTACSKDNNDVNAVSKITRYEFTANIADDTRSGFAEKEEGATAYKSEWFGDETLKIFVTNYQGYYVETTAEINEMGQFTLELENAPESFFMSVCSPAESWVSENTATIPTEQTPLANSVDPKAHVLYAQAVPVSGDSASITMSPQNACYGKMTVNASDFEISKVEISFNGGQVYTLNAKNVENNVFWFAVPSPIEVTTFTVTAYDAENNAITKTVDVAADKLKFQWGRVSTFSVSELAAVVEPEGPVFTSASSDATAYSYSDCYLTFEGENLGTLVLNAYHVVNEILELPVGSYMLTEAPGNFWTAGYSTFIPAGTETTYNLTSGTVKVSVVNNEYVIEFIDLAYGSNVLNATYTGTITGLNLADPRQELPIPSNVKATVSGKTITLSWDSVEGADGYQVKMWNPNDEEKIEVVTVTQYVFEAQKSNTTYHFNVYSYANDDNASYKTSLNWSYVYTTTEDTDPKIVLSKETIPFTADGGDVVVDVTLKNIDGDFTYTVDADWLTVTRSGATSLAVSAPAYDNESEDRSATITITAGDLTKNIAVTQSKKAAQGGGGLSGCPADATELTIESARYAGFYNPYVELAFHESDLVMHVFDVYFGGYPNISAGTYTSANGDFDTNYTYYDYYKFPQTKPSDIVMNVIANGGDNFTFEVTMVANGTKYYFVYTGDFPVSE